MKKALGAIPLLSWFVACGPPATLTQIESEIFAKSCAFTTCHAGPRPTGSLNLEGRTYARLVNVKADSREFLVVPSAPDESWLFKKLTGSAPATIMPPDEALTAAKIEMVRSWIAAGAQDN